MSSLVRTHIALPRELLDELDARVGPRKRSEVIAEIVEEYLRRQRLAEAIQQFAGSISAEDHPEWATEEDVANWVHNMRRNEWSQQEQDVP